MSISPNESLAQSTPGPWQLYADLPSADPNWHIVTNEARMRVIANVHIEPGNQTDLANARLIAASPCLLAACEQYISATDYLYKTEMHDNYTDRARARNKQAEAIEMMRAAIQKARGEQP